MQLTQRAPAARRRRFTKPLSQTEAVYRQAFNAETARLNSERQVREAQQQAEADARAEENERAMRELLSLPEDEQMREILGGD
jgi:hypothetical protein